MKSLERWHPPPEIPYARTLHTVAWLDGLGKVIDSGTGEVLVDAKDAAELAAGLCGPKILCLVEDLLRHPWLPELLRLATTKQGFPILGGYNDPVTGMMFRLGPNGRGGALVDVSKWGLELGDHVKLADLFFMYGFSSVGPGGLAEKMVRAEFECSPGITRPSDALRERILDHHVAFLIDGKWESAKRGRGWHYDFNSHFMNIARMTPTPFNAPKIGPCPGLDDDRPMLIEAEVMITETCPVAGPLPVKSEFRSKAEWPRVKGRRLKGWWWKEQLQAAAGLEWEMKLGRSYVWDRYSPWLDSYVDGCEKRKRETADDPVLNQLVKKTDRAIWGRWIAACQSLNLIEEYEMEYGAKNEWLATRPDGEPTGYAIRSLPDPAPNYLTQISAYVQAMGALKLWELIQEAVRQGATVKSFYVDGMITDKQVAVDLGLKDGQLKEDKLGLS